MRSVSAKAKVTPGAANSVRTWAGDDYDEEWEWGGEGEGEGSDLE